MPSPIHINKIPAALINLIFSDKTKYANIKVIAGYNAVNAVTKCAE